MTAALVGLVAMALILSVARPAPRRLPDPRSAQGSARPSLQRIHDLVDRALPGRRRQHRDQQLPDTVDRLASALRAGDAIGPALVALAPDIADPLGSELRAVARSIDRGTPVAEALAAWTRSADASPDVQMVAAALSLGARAGGEVARAVDGVAATLRERHELRAETRALATQARASAGVLGVAPIAFALLVGTIEPGAVGFLFTTPVGLACLMAGLALEAAGVVWMERITRGPA